MIKYKLSVELKLHRGLKMFGFFKRDELKLLENKYVLILEEAMHAQRNGKIEEFSEISFQAEKMLKEIESLKELRKKEK